MSQVFVLVVALLTALPAHANQLAPLLPFVSAWGWLGLPLIILIEWFILKRFELPSPFKLALQVNVASSLFGLPFTLANIFFPIPGLFLVYSPRALDDAQRQVNAIGLHGLIGLVAILAMGWISYRVEFKTARRLLEPNFKVATRPFALANCATYSILIAIYLVAVIKALLEAYEHLARFTSAHGS